MTLFIIKRLIALVLILFVVVTGTFFIVRFSKGGPFDKDRKLPPQIEKLILAKYKLDAPLGTQYVGYMKSLLKGDMGVSYRYLNRSVNEIIGQTLPVSMTLGAVALVIALVLGVSLGSYAAVNQNKLGDVGSMVFALFSISIPTYVTAPLLILLFCLIIPLFPVGGWGRPSQVILPALCLSLPYIASVARLMRTSMLEVLNQDFVRTARAKGLPEREVIFKHALKVAILPVVSYAGPLAANILTGSLVIEEIFKIPGIGPFFLNSVTNKDYQLVGGVVIVYCMLLVTFNILVDIAYTFLDRRIKLS
ncbi:MAG: ABC transporter permease [Verrucomicrobiota bacterium]|nr:ABC transporter permease [Verrucomicrobiota bacterium]